MWPYKKKPCKNCPLRKGSQKVGKEEISYILQTQNYYCQATPKKSDKMACAGHLILKKQENQFYRFSHKIGIRLELQETESVFNTTYDASKYHEI